MKKVLIAFLIYFPSIKVANAQSVSTFMGAQAAGLGYCVSTQANEWSSINNIGGLSKIEQTSLAFAVEILPTLTGANRLNALGVFPFESHAVGINLFRFGDNLYNEQMISMGYSNSFGITSLGLRLNYIQYRAEGFKTRNYLTIDFGGVTNLTDRFSVGAFIKNLNQPQLSDSDGDRIRAQMVFGLKYSPAEYINIIGEIDKTLDEITTWKGSIEYIVYKKVFFRTGFNLDPNAAFFGVGYKNQKFNFDYAVQFMEQLKAGHQISVSYTIQKKSE